MGGGGNSQMATEEGVGYQVILKMFWLHLQIEKWSGNQIIKANSLFLNHESSGNLRCG